MDTRVVANIAIFFSGLLLNVIIILLTMMENRFEKHISRFFILYVSIISVIILCTMQMYFCRGNTDPGWIQCSYISGFFAVLCSILQAFLVGQFFLDILGGGKAYRRYRIPVILIAGFQIVMLVLAQYNGMMYRFDSSNYLHLGPWFQPVTWLSSVIILMALFLLLRYRNGMDPGVFRDFLIYFTLPLVGMVLQVFIPGVYTMHASLILANLIMFFSFLKRETRRYHLRGQENEQMKQALMLSQIQPHFLYNSLGVIQELCHSNPVKAEKATGTFSRFLRRNMDSLTMDRPIPFEDELEHTRNYLELEKMRFGDNLRVEYDIETTDFLIPTLSLQPLVENSVRHGIRRKEEGGTVHIEVRELPDRIEVRVRDDGPGIAPDDFTDPKRSDRIGVRNVTERIRRMCGGNLQLEFQPGTGSNAVITLPKRKENRC